MVTLARSSPLYARLRAVRNRLVIARKRLTAVHPTSYVNPSAHVARDFEAGEFVYVGRDCVIPPMVSIERYTMLAPQVAIIGDDHNWDQPGVPMQFTGRPPQRPTTIGADVWIGQGVILMRGVDVGDGSIIAAGSVVTRSIPAYEVWAGVPARKLRDRFDDPQSLAQHAAMLTGPLVAPTFAEPLDFEAVTAPTT